MSNLLYTDLYYVMAQLNPVWPNLTKKRIFLTGGTGFIGKWLVETFAVVNKALDLEAEMVVLSRKTMFSTDKAVTFIQGDVCDFTFPEGQFDYVIHAAGGRGEDTFQVAVKGTERVLAFAKQCGAKRVLYLSSGAVYNTDTLDPEGAYGEGKRAGEMLCTLSGLDTRIARVFTLVGPEMDLGGYAIGRFLMDGLAGKPVRVVNGKNVTRSYLYASDMTTALWMMLLYEKANRVYNVGSSEGITIAEVATLVADVCGVEVEQVEGTYPDSVYLPPPGPKANISLREAIERTVAWHREQK